MTAETKLSIPKEKWSSHVLCLRITWRTPKGIDNVHPLMAAARSEELLNAMRDPPDRLGNHSR